MVRGNQLEEKPPQCLMQLESSQEQHLSVSYCINSQQSAVNMPGESDVFKKDESLLQCSDATGDKSASCWLAKPCVFFQREQRVGRCKLCDDPFSFWRGKKHCEYCGCVFDSKCTVTNKLPGDFFKTRICLHCHQYKNCCGGALREGDDFISYGGEFPAATHLCLSELTSSVVITIDPNEHLTIRLADIVCIQKGFSHTSHMKNEQHYDPMRCFMISAKISDSQVRVFDLKADSAQHRELWVNGLNTAKYVSERVKEQQRALSLLLASGKTPSANGLLRRKYYHMPERSQSSSDQDRTSSMSRRSMSEGDIAGLPRSLSSSPEILQSVPTREMVVEVFEESDLVIVEEVVPDNGSRGTSPGTPSSDEDSDSPAVHHTHYKLKTGTIPCPKPHPQLSSKHDKLLKSDCSSIKGLPYRRNNNPLASYCDCHSYAIQEPRAMLFPIKSPPRDPFITCCERCRNKCPVVRDLSNI